MAAAGTAAAAGAPHPAAGEASASGGTSHDAPAGVTTEAAAR